MNALVGALLLGCYVPLRRSALAAMIVLVGCGGFVDDDATEECERSEYELERTRYRCTSAGELQTLDCGDWVTLETCFEPAACSPGPDPGCR